MKARHSPLRAFAATAVLSHALIFATAAQARQAEPRGVSVRTADGAAVKLYDKSYALVIGVSDYTQGWPKLPGVKQDAEAVSAALERHGFEVTLVMNPNSAQLDNSFREFISARGREVNNRLLFYFAGHGHTVKQSYGEEMGYIVPADAPNPHRDQNGFLDRAMSMRQIELYAESVQSKHVLFLFDSCFSGSLFALSRAVPESISYKTSRHVRQFITSGSADEQVPDKSIFRRQFSSALEGEADMNRDGYVTGTELGEFLQERVVNYSRNAQHPQYGKIRNPNLDKGDFVFALPKAAAPPPAAGALAATPPQPTRSRADQAAVELAFWDTIKNSTDPEDFDAYLKKYPDGEFAALARRRARPAPDAATPTTAKATPPAASHATPIPTPTPSATPTASAAGEAETAQAVEALRTLGAGRIDLGKFGEGFGVTHSAGPCRIKYEERALWNSKARFKPTILEVVITLTDINVPSIGVVELKQTDRPALWVATARTVQGRTFTVSVTGYENRSLEKVKVPTKMETPTATILGTFMDSDTANRYAKAFAAAARLCGAKSETF